MTWIDQETRGDFEVQPLGIGPRRRYVVRPRRTDGRLAKACAEQETYADADQLRARCRDALRRREPWAVDLVTPPPAPLGSSPEAPAT